MVNIQGISEAGNWQLRYWTIFIGQGFSLVGSMLTQFVLMWWITDTTGSVVYLATAGMVAMLPQALLSPLGGVLADRYSRRLMMIVSDATSALCMVVLILLLLTDSMQLWHVYIMMGARGAMQAFQNPASSASMAMLVPRSFLTRAAGLNQMLQGVTIVASAPLGAIAISLMPLGWALSIDVITAFLGIVPLMIYSIPQIIQKTNGSLFRNMGSELLEGVSFIWKNPGLKRLYGLLACIFLIVMPCYTFIPLLVKEYFKGGASEVGIIEGLGGAGMVVGGIILAAVAPKQKIRWILVGSFLSCITLFFIAVTPSNLFWVALIMWLANGIAFIFANTPLTALLQEKIPNQFQGRVLSLLSTLMTLAAPLGLALAAPLGELIGIRWLFLILGILGSLVSLMGFISKSLIKMDEQE